ncbi:MAG TPA: hypothetical protein VF628_11230 [Allosphingosinicella sp.]|jgi:transcriptional regulator with XRE-family HTH domain
MTDQNDTLERGPREVPLRGDSLRPGEYIRLRRRAAGFTTQDVAAAIGRNIVDQADVQDQLARLERGEPELATASLEGAPLGFHDLVDRLAQVFALDGLVYHALVGLADNPGLPAPHICRGCGCTWHDACQVAGGAGCSWSDADPNICTACEAEAGQAFDTLRSALADRDPEPGNLGLFAVAIAAIGFAAIPGRALATFALGAF